MDVRAHLPSRQIVLAAVGLIGVIAIPVLICYLTVGHRFAAAMFQGAVAMLIAITHLPLTKQVTIGVCAGLVAGLGASGASFTFVLLVVVVAACATQSVFSQWSVSSAALIPSLAVSNAAAGGGVVASATGAWAGAALAVGLALTLKRREGPKPVVPAMALRHAALLAVGCIILVIGNKVVSFPHGVWAVSTLCLVFLPASPTRAHVRERIIATVLGAMAATVIAVALPQPVCLALAGVTAVLTVVLALTPDARLPIVAFLTPTYVLTYGAGRPASVATVAGERVLLTVAAGLLAIALTAVLSGWTTRRPNPTAIDA